MLELLELFWLDALVSAILAYLILTLRAQVLTAFVEIVSPA